MNWGWYVVYILTIVINSIVCNVNGFTLVTWQYWAYACLLILTFVAGANYRNKE